QLCVLRDRKQDRLTKRVKRGIMNRRLTPSIAISTSALLLLNASSSSASSSTISGLQDSPEAVYQVFGLNQSGQFTGFFYDFPVAPHAFSYSNGSRTDLGTLGGTTSEGH